MRYACYDLIIDSVIDLPELQPCRAEDAIGDAQVHITQGDLPATGESFGKQLAPFMWASHKSLYLRVPQVARFLVEDGTTIVFAPEGDVDVDSVRLFLLGTALGALLSQRGLLVMHGNSVRIGSQCLVCVGPSGAGKSTLAAGLMQRGYEVLADDVVPIDAEGRALPGFPRIKLWQDAAESLNVPTAGLRRVRPDMHKFNLPLAPDMTRTPLPVRWVYLLSSSHAPGVLIEPVNGMERFQLLHDNLYRIRYLRGTGRRAEHLALCGKLASQIRLARVTRPDTGFELDPLIDALLADIGAHP